MNVKQEIIHVMRMQHAQILSDRILVNVKLDFQVMVEIVCLYVNRHVSMVANVLHLIHASVAVATKDFHVKKI